LKTNTVSPIRKDIIITACVLAFMALSFLLRTWWTPGFVIPHSLSVMAALGLVWITSHVDIRLGAGCAMAVLIACALFFPPEFHLWGDGALRIRNLAAGFPMLDAAPMEAGDYAIRLLMARIGLSPEDTYRITGVLGGGLYLWGLIMVIGSRERGRTAAAKMAIGVSPTWMVFFTGYVESYALPAGLFALYTGLIFSGAKAIPVAVTAMGASVFHLAGLALIPGAVLHALPDRRKAGGYIPFILLGSAAVLIALPLLVGGIEKLTGLLQWPNPPARLALVFFAAPALPILLRACRAKVPHSLWVALALFMVALVFFDLERGEAIDWDLGALFLVVPFLLMLKRYSRPLLPWVAAASILLSGPRIGAFLNTNASEARYRSLLENCGDPAAFEEMAILLRDRGDLQEAARLLGKAFDLSENGRHLAMLSEVRRMQGRPDLALAAASRAVELRPCLETAWLQLAFAARDAGDPGESLRAAEGHSRNFPGHDGPGLWPVALETAVNAGQAEAAWRAAQPLLSLGSKDPAVLINLAGAAYLNNRLETAAFFLQEAAAVSPENPLVLFNQGLVHLGLRDTLAAEGFLLEALRLEPGLAGARILLGELADR